MLLLEENTDNSADRAILGLVVGVLYYTAIDPLLLKLIERVYQKGIFSTIFVNVWIFQRGVFFLMNKFGRVIHGNLKRRLIKMPHTISTRPTADIIKESIFNILVHRININFEEIAVIDLFAGSGAMGIEAISLGAKSALFVDCNYSAIKCIKQNLYDLNISEYSIVINKKVEELNDSLIAAYCENFETILIFIDPPYSNKSLLISQIERINSILSQSHKAAIVITESDKVLNIPRMEAIHKIRKGKTFVFFSKIPFSRIC
ncbi:MAG: RsmD family RNA methyltransferase [Holosporales bacterium]|jgi:16S rRNA (guanine(966)-N(2))-methyltransferase RsmD|nr:RsmD family RNA methyltransferase [Holosporales bacterium]